MNIKNKVRSAVSGAVERLVRHSVVFRDTERKLRSVEERASRIEGENRELAERASRIEGENRELAERTRAIGNRLCNVSVQRPPDPMGRRLRVVIEIDAIILERGFLHGDDATMIDYIGRDIGARAAREIRRANFQRWEV